MQRCPIITCFAAVIERKRENPKEIDGRVSETKAEKETDRQRETETETDRQIDRQRGRQTEQTDRERIMNEYV